MQQKLAHCRGMVAPPIQHEIICSLLCRWTYLSLCGLTHELAAVRHCDVATAVLHLHWPLGLLREPRGRARV